MGSKWTGVRRSMVMLGLALVLAACGGDSTSPVTVTVSITPGQATVGAAGTQQFSATVTGTSNTEVTWSASGGTIVGSGNSATFTAPIAGGTITITATSTAEPTESGTATVTVTPVAVSLAPSSDQLVRGQEVTLQAAVTGTESTGVTWTTSCGTLEETGLSAMLTAPATVPDSACTVTVTSELDTAQSATFTFDVVPDWLVTTTADPGTGTCTPASCSLRQALGQVATGGPVDADGRGVIRFTDDLAGETVTLNSSLAVINTAVRIMGPTAGMVTIDANGSESDPRWVLEILPDGDVEAHRVRLTGGHGGGGVRMWADAALALFDSEVTDNVGTGLGGGIRSVGNNEIRLVRTVISGNTTTLVGGGMYVGLSGESVVHLDEVTIADNRSENGGGGVFLSNSVLEGSDVTISGNEAGSTGGGITVQSGATLRLTGSALSGNSASGGGGMLAWGATVNVELTDVELVGNTSSSVAGAIWAESGAVVEAVGLLASGNSADLGGGALTVMSQASVAITGSTQFENAGGGGGAIQVAAGGMLDLRDATLRDNASTAQGGAIWVISGSLTLRDVQVLQNTAVSTGGGIEAEAGTSVDLERIRVSGNEAGSGGGIVSNGELVLRNSTIDGNRALTSFSGGIRLLDAGQSLIENVTIVGNEAIGRGGAGTLSGAVTLNGVTVANNVVDGAFAGGFSLTNSGGLPTFRNTLLSGNLASGVPSNCASVTGGTGTSEGNNLSDDDSCAFFLTQASDLNDATAGLAPALADNGGPTPTLALLAGSAAIDAGNPTNCLASDQRGFARSGTCDIGAFEFEGIEP